MFGVGGPVPFPRDQTPDKQPRHLLQASSDPTEKQSTRPHRFDASERGLVTHLTPSDGSLRYRLGRLTEVIEEGSILQQVRSIPVSCRSSARKSECTLGASLRVVVLEASRQARMSPAESKPSSFVVISWRTGGKTRSCFVRIGTSRSGSVFVQAQVHLSRTASGSLHCPERATRSESCELALHASRNETGKSKLETSAMDLPNGNRKPDRAGFRFSSSRGDPGRAGSRSVNFKADTQTGWHR